MKPIAVMLDYGKDSLEFEQLKNEMDELNKVSAALNAASVGVSVDFSKLIDDDKTFEPIGLMKMWKELERRVP